MTDELVAFTDVIESRAVGIERVLCAYDDRDRVVVMWRAEGIPCFQVAPGDF